MPRRKPVRGLIRSSAVFERNAAGDLDPGEWVRLTIPPELVRVVVQDDGREVIELHMMAASALVSERATIDEMKDAVFLCRCPLPVIRPEDLK